MSGRQFWVRTGSEEHDLEVLDWDPPRDGNPGRLRVRVDGEELEATSQFLGRNRIELVLPDGKRLVQYAADREGRHLSVDGCHIHAVRLARRRAAQVRELPPEVTPPMPAVVVRVLVAKGERVEQGQPLVIVSAMKMETTLRAPHAGRVTAVHAGVGDKVNPGQVLVFIEEGESDDGEG